MKKVLLVLLLLLGFLCLAEASLIGSASWDGSGGTSLQASGIRFSLAYLIEGDCCGNTDEDSRVFDVHFTDTTHPEYIVTPADVGKEILATSDSKGFVKFANYITDNSDDQFEFFMRYDSTGNGVGSLRRESEWFGTAPDFYGYTIEALGLKINSLTIGPSEWSNTMASWNVTLNVYGHQIAQPVPEPITLLLLATGLIGMSAYRRKTLQGLSLNPPM